MALNPLVDSRDIQFVLFEMLKVQSLGEDWPQYSDYDQETLQDFIDLAERIAYEQMYPVSHDADSEGCTYNPDTKEVKIPKGYKGAIDAFYEAGFMGAQTSQENDGLGVPLAVASTTTEMLCAGCFPAMMFPGLSQGLMHLVENFATNEIREIYRPKLMSGEWGGTMCISEPDAGSDVGALKTKAVPLDDGTYKISGQKIFISSGENDYYGNMIHAVLARVEGDPAGTKGISIFLVPKYRINSDGSNGEANDVVCSGIEHKMGIHGSPTCTLSFGDNGKCIGYLLGEQKKGMRIMFQMMNEARLGVGLQALAVSSKAYMHSVTYAKNRYQGVHVTQLLNADAEKVTISQHPDIKRTLLWMKSHVEGMRVISYFLSHNINLFKISEGETKEHARALADILTPIVKAGNSDSSVLITSEAIQLYGGYGYCNDYPIEQMMRDSKITTIYEGTNGVQAMDLALRKILMNENQVNYGILKETIQETIAGARGIVADKYVDLVERGLQQLDSVIEMMKTQMSEMKILHLFMNATPLQQAMFMLMLAWAHLWSLTISYPKMKEIIGGARGEERTSLLQNNKEAAYYSARVLSAQFYLGSEFPKYFGNMEAILFGETAVIKAGDETFTGALEE